MDILLLENADTIRKQFEEHFVQSWEVFQVTHQKWIAEMAQVNYPIDFRWYQNSLMWDKMGPNLPWTTFSKALSLLRQQPGNVLILSEGNNHPYPGTILHKGEKISNFVAQVDAKELADLMEQEWVDSFVLPTQNMYNPNPILPEDIYVFDESMRWFIVFTHEATDLNAQFEDPLKAAESRYCIFYGL